MKQIYTLFILVLFGSSALYADNTAALRGDELVEKQIIPVSQQFKQLGDRSDHTAQKKINERVSLKDFGAVGDGVTDDTKAIQDWFNYILSTLNSKSIKGGKMGYIPAGLYRTTGLSLSITDIYGLVIYGDGYESCLENVEFNFGNNTYFCQLRNLSLIGNAVKNGISIGVSTQSNVRAISIVNCYIKDRTFGIVSWTGAFHHITNSFILSCGVGIHIRGSAGTNIENSEILSNKKGGVLISAGGETKFNNNRILNNRGYGLKIAYAPNPKDIDSSTCYIYKPDESYFIGNTITLNGDAQHYKISSIKPYRNGKMIQVDFKTSTYLTRNLGDVHLAGTGIKDYDNVKTYVKEVLSPSSVVLNLPYKGGVNKTGKLISKGWDLIFKENKPGMNRSFYFTGGNINNTYINGVYNLSFIGTRLKHRIYMEGNNNAYISFIRHGATGTPVQADIPISGTSSNKGWVEIKVSQGDNMTGWKGGNESLIIQAPKAGSKIKKDQTPSKYNKIEVGVKGLSLNKSLYDYNVWLDNNTAISLSPPSKIASNGEKFVVDGGYLNFLTMTGKGQINLSWSAGLIEYCTRKGVLSAKKVQGGSKVNCTTGILKGTTGKNGYITLSVFAGKIYIENRVGSKRHIRFKFQN